MEKTTEFKLISEDKNSNARAGIIKTFHGEILTPIFMPVGTVGSVKAVHQTEIKNDIQASIILGNTYHLYLRPGMEIIEKAGGLHKFMNWDKNILTDSGGYQVFSLSKSRKINEDGVYFKSHIDGSTHFLSPEIAIKLQRSIGADIIMAFDECPPYPCEYKYLKKSIELTLKWLKECFEAMKKFEPLYGYEQALFPIIQGGTNSELRKFSAENTLNFDSIGYAIGGLSVGEPKELIYENTHLVCSIIPKDKARYLMGVGTPANILECINMGCDMFDCVMPSRNGRNGWLFTWDGIINIKNEKWKKDFSPIDEKSDCFVDKIYSKAYLRHLFMAKEILGYQITTIHNLAFYIQLVKEARKKILNHTFAQWKNNLIPILEKKI